MSVIPPSIIKTYAEALGITSLSEEIIDLLTQDAEYRLREVIQEATKFMFHGKRTKLTVEDLNYAVQSRNMERLYGYEPAEPLNFRPVPNSSIFYIPKGEFDLMEFVQQPLPKAPQPLTLTSHWLAIDGVQPMIPENPQPSVFPLGVEPEGTGTAATTAIPGRKEEETEVKPLVRHIISKELQNYFDAIISHLQSVDGERVKVALQSVSNDSGLQQLLPYFVQWIAESVVKNLRNLAQLNVCIGLLHQLMPPLLSCLLGKSICENPEIEDHWSLRDRCATIVAEICQRFGNVYTNLIPRIAKTLHKTLLDPEKSLACHYGAIVGISALGAHSIHSLLLPNLEGFLSALGVNQMATDDAEAPAAIPIDIKKTKTALRQALLKWKSEVSEAKVEIRNRIDEVIEFL